MSSFLSLKNLHCSFELENGEEKKVLKGLNLEIHAHEFISIIGSNGAGKSTLFNAISGSIPIQTGEIQLQNKRLNELPPHKRALSIARIHQEPLLGTASNMSLEDNMLLYSQKGRKTLRRSLTKKKTIFFHKEIAQLNQGLENRLKENMSLFSGGQRQALTLLMSTMSNPALLLLDEHTAALDPDNAEIVMQLTKKIIRRKKMTALMITHNMQHALDYGNRLIMLDEGQVVLDFSGQEKKELTVAELIRQFQKKRPQSHLSDELIFT